MAAAMMLLISMLMVVVAAAHIRIITKISGKQRLYRLVRVPGYTAVKPDTRFRQRCLGSAANAAANQRVHAVFRQKSGQSAVAAAIGIHHLGVYHLSIRHIVELKLFCVSKMLKNLSIFVGNCNLHN